jgi:hypothetical protein
MTSKTLLFFVLSFSILLTNAFAEDITITTYYPAPYGVYKVLRLYPSDDFTLGNACNNNGELAYDNSDNQLYICRANTWQVAGGGGYWKLDTTTDPHYLYLDTVAVPDPNTKVGIGTTTPVTKLEVQGGAIKATGGLIIEIIPAGNPEPAETGRIWLVQ